ncbi:TPR repeat-containing protein [Enhydrobacter aerosaccus]|uniref:TPR repeat-containing protein n=1 Tax=Enhydrobacter aerosaccus TaxID=225324 RepID=A0A1T4MZ13_9HYPH|nr:tetratricopeptide repeat protein [Enhydrobacter aerosaccus]SJZ72299.1 TPR repeat-containing protein [Enhydrobacter aerosaccus]
MRPIPLALLSAALLLTTSLSGMAQSTPPAKSPAGVPQRASAPGTISLEGRYLAGRVAEEDHDYDSGAEQLDLALAQAPNDPTLVYGAFRMRVYAGRFDAAALLAPQVLATKPGDGFANLVLTVQHIKRGDYRAAEQQLARIGAENQLGPLKDFVVAWLKAGEKDYAAARDILARLKPRQGNDRAEAPSLIIRAQIDEMAGDRAAAETKYRRAAELDPAGLRIVVSAAEGLERLGKVADGRALLKAYGDKYSDSVVMDGLLAPNAPAPKPPSPASGVAEILFDIGGILGSDQRNERADLALIFEQLAVELKPDFDFAWLMIAGIDEQFGRIPQAVAALGKIGPTSPLNWQARLRAATLDAQEDKIDSAVRRLQAMVAEKPDRIDAALSLADLLRTKERYQEAVAAYDTAISRIKGAEDRYWPIHFGRGIALERLKQWPRAEADMKKALELSPEQPYVLNYLGYSWIDQGVHLDDGMKMLKRATELRPDDGAITDSVGWAYYRLGQFDEAVKWLERATEQKGDDATVVEHLGDAYWHVGRFREARFEWQRAVNQKPDKDRLPVLQDKLSNGLNVSNDKPTVYEKEKSADKKQGG